MFTDVVGSTERAAELGDARWKKLLNAHHTAMRRLLKRHGGREVDTAGDGFFMTFEQPADAIACALDMIETLGAIGIHIRAGVHFGEVEILDDKVAGMTVHIGARIMSQGGADELIVSSTVRDLMTGSDLPFEDRGFQSLKGVESQWHVYSVQGRTREREELSVSEPAPVTPPWRQPLVVGAFAAVLVMAVVAVVFFSADGDTLAPAPNTVVRLGEDGVTHVVRVGSAPQALVADGSSLWVANTLDLTVQRIDLDADVAEPAEGGFPDGPTSIAATDGYVWVGSSLSDGSLMRIDPTEKNSAQVVPLGGPVSGLATAPGTLWATDRDAGLLRRYEIASGEVDELPLPEGSGPMGIAVDDNGSLWVAFHDARAVAHVDPATGDVLDEIDVEAGHPDRVTTGAGYVWVSVGDGDAVLRIDPAGGSPFTIAQACDQPSGIAATDDAVWVACMLDGRVLRLDPGSGDVVDDLRLGVDLGPAGVAIAEGSPWVSLIGR